MSRSLPARMAWCFSWSPRQIPVSLPALTLTIFPYNHPQKQSCDGSSLRFPYTLLRMLTSFISWVLKSGMWVQRHLPRLRGRELQSLLSERGHVCRAEQVAVEGRALSSPAPRPAPIIMLITRFAQFTLPYALLSDRQRVLIKALGAADGKKTKRSHFIFEKGGKLLDRKIPVKPADRSVPPPAPLGHSSHSHATMLQPEARHAIHQESEPGRLNSFSRSVVIVVVPWAASSDRWTRCMYLALSPKLLSLISVRLVPFYLLCSHP